jgi:hypothetical protein
MKVNKKKRRNTERQVLAEGISDRNHFRKEANNMMIIKLIAKIPLLPVLLIIRIAGVLLYGIAWILAHLAGPVLTLFVVCGAYAVYTQNWAAVAVFAISSVLLFLFFLASGLVIGLVETAGDLVSMCIFA